MQPCKVKIEDIAPMVISGVVGEVTEPETFGMANQNHVQAFLLVDPKSKSKASVRVAMYNEQVRNLGGLLRKGMSVQLTGFNVREVKEQRTPVTNHKYEVSLTRDTKVEILGV